MLVNTIDREPDDSLPVEIYAELEPKGFAREDLLGVTHTFIAKKNQRRITIWRRRLRDLWR